MTRRRVLSADERALWESVAKQARPLRKRTRVPKIEIKAEIKAEIVVAAEPVSTRASGKRSANQSAPPPGKPVATKSPPPLTPLARRERTHLSRGRIEIDARLDLHGMTQARAHRALLHFLQHASSDGLRFVLVVTGKGSSAGPQSERGVLRRQVPEWLSLPEFRAFVIGFEEAHIGHGGGGALYVRVRRGR